MPRNRQIHMTRGGGVHTVPAKDAGWINEIEGTVLNQHRIKENAVIAGRAYAQHWRVEHTIHNRDGVIAEKNSYGKDPNPPKDKR